MTNDSLETVDTGRTEDFMRHTLLIADDTAQDRALLSHIFAVEYRILCASDGAEVMILLKNEPDISVVLLDLCMPKLDGYEVLRRMGEQNLLSRIPVIVVTSVDDTENQLRVLRLGAADFVSKPYNSLILTHRVRNLLDRLDAARASEQTRLYEMKMKLQAEQLRQAEHDPLTGLYNRAAFILHAGEAIRRMPANFYILSYLDIDSFKVINDRFGHAEGDRLLQFIAKTQSEEVEKVGGIACRNMGDTFLTLLPNDSDQLEQITRRLLHSIQDYDLGMSVNLHIGRYVVDEPALEVSAMIDRALLAVRSVKGSANERIAWFDDKMRSGVLRRQTLVEAMRPALEKGQFAIWFQPQYDYSSGEMIGAEALVRWEHPEMGLLSPAEFIPLFEENGFISSLDQYVWERTCRYLRDWSAQGLPVVPISVNLSRRDISNPRLPAMFADLADRYALSPSLLRLEITESAYVENPAQMISAVETLQNYGFLVEMDDFGSGYSSLNTLKDVPVDILKLDMKFLSASDAHNRSGSILSSVVRMAHWLHLPVLAEGVEDQNQADYLKSIGCPLMQGYFFSRPMSASSFCALLAQQTSCVPTLPKRPVDLKGAADFLNASTQATLLFNSFVGAAQIVEFDGEHLESLRVNDRYFEVLGCTREEYAETQLDILLCYPPEFAETLKQTLRSARDSGNEAQCELRMKPFSQENPDIWVLARLRFLADNGGREVFYLSVENITGRVELDETRKRLDDVVRNIPAGVVICEYGTPPSVNYVSDRALALFGFTKPEFEHWLSVESQETSMRCLSSDLSRQFPSEEALQDITLPARRKNGSWFWLRIASGIVLRPNQPPLVYSTLFDVSSQHADEEELRALINAMPGGVFRYRADSTQRISFISPNMLDMLGYTREEFADAFEDRFDQMVFQEDRERVLREIDEQIAQNGAHDHCEYRIVMKDGRHKWVYDAGHLVTDAEGKQFFYVIIVDIDERKRLEEELAKEASRNEALVTNAPGGVTTLVVQDGEIRCDYVSKGMIRLFGRTLEELQTAFYRDPFALIHPEDADLVREHAEDAICQRRAFQEQYRSEDGKGGVIWVSFYGNPMVSPDGVLQYICIYVDVTDRILANQHLEFERQKTAYALQYAKVAIWEYDLSRAVFRKLSQFAHDLLPDVVGHVPESLIDTGLIAPESADEYLRLHAAVMAGEETVSGDIRLRTEKDAPFVWRRITYRTMFSNGTPVGAVGTAIDISAEAEARTASREMELAMEASSLYFWTLDPKQNRYVSKNRNALAMENRVLQALRRAKSSAGEKADDSTCRINELTICVQPESMDKANMLLQLLANGSYAEGRVELHLYPEVSGVEWMRIAYAPVCDDEGHIVTITAIGEDVTERVRREQMVLPRKPVTDSFQSNTLMTHVFADLTENRLEDCPEAGKTYEMALEGMISRVITQEQRERIQNTLSREALLEAFAAGEHTRILQYQSLAEGETRPHWMCTSVRLDADPATGHVKCFQYTLDVDNEVTTRRIIDTVFEQVYDLLGLISLPNGVFHCYGYTGSDHNPLDWNNVDYSSTIVRFIEAYVPKDNCVNAGKALSLSTILEQLNAHRVYKVVLPVEHSQTISWKRWEFFWLDEERTSVVLTRIDVSEEEQLRVQSEQMKLALQTSNTVVCSYDPASHTLILPSKYASALELPEVIEDPPSHDAHVAPGDRARYAGFFHRMDLGEPSGEITLQMRLPNGHARFEHVRFSLAETSDGTPTHAVITVKDVTAQHRQQIENERAHLIMECNGIAIVDYDMRSDVLYFEATRADLGLVKQSMTDYLRGLGKRTLIAPESVETIRKLITEAGEAPISGEAEFRADIWGMGMRWCGLFYRSLADESGVVYRAVGQIRDIEEDKERETLVKELRSRIRQNESLPVYDPVLISSVFQYLYEAEDITDAIQQVLGLIGSHFGVSRAYIFEDADDHLTTSNTFEWCAEGIPPELEKMQNLSYADFLGANYRKNFDQNGLFILPDVHALSENFCNFMLSQGIASMLQCAIYYEGKFYGFVGFDDCRHPREWSPGQIGSLAVLCRLISLYLFKERQHEAAVLSGDFLTALDNSSLPVYLVEPSTHRLIFRNRVLRRTFGEFPDGTTCYAAVTRSDRPCASCPMSTRDSEGNFLPVEVLRHDGKCMLTQASPVCWKGQDIYMLTCVDITDNKKAQDALRVSAEENAIVIRQSGKQVFRYDIAADTAENMLDRSDILGMPWHIPHFEAAFIERGVVMPESVREYRACMADIRAGKPRGSCNLLVRTPNSTRRWYHMDYSMIYHEGTPSHAILLFFDNTVQREREIAYQKWQARLSAVLTQNTPYLEVNLTTGELERAENLHENMNPHRWLEDYVDQAEKDLVAERDVPRFHRFFNRERLLGVFYAGEQDVKLEYRAMLSGREVWYRIDVQMIKEPYSDSVKAFVIFTDIDQEKRSLERLEESASRDSLTHLLNRAVMEQSVNRILERAEEDDRFAMFMVDLDNFKRVNDTYGHQCGDEVLVKTAEVLEGNFRPTDLTARVGGDEFMVFMSTGVSRSAVNKKARCILEALRIKQGELEVSASVGIALANREMRFSEVYQIADRALYAAKRNGKNRFSLQG